MQNYSLVGDERLEIGDLLCTVQFCLYKISSLFEVEKIVWWSKLHFMIYLYSFIHLDICIL
jgi:hypothetical protein